MDTQTSEPIRAVSDHVHALIADAKALAKAELALQKLRAAVAGKLAGRIAVMGVAALALAHFALMALVLGLILALAPLLTAWGAMGAVVGGLLLFTVICALVALAAWRRLRALIADVAVHP